jgi:hypothetical protein
MQRRGAGRLAMATLLRKWMETHREQAAEEGAGSAAWPLLRRVVVGLAVGIVLATCVFAVGRVTWRMLSTDGGWYSYPAYALSQGRDADENLLPPDELPLATPGVRSLFPWENRSLLLTGIDWAWFVLAGHGQRSIVAFGVLQWLAIAGLVGWAVHRATGNRWATAAAALCALSDAKLVHESLADLRPDIPLALIAVASLCCFIHYLRKRSPVSFIASGLLILLLPLVQTTGVLPAAMMLTCLGMSALMPADGRVSRPYMLACAMVAVATVAAFIFRKPIMDVLIPTKVPLAYQLSGRHDFPALLRSMADRGVAWKLSQESRRWIGYFLPANLAQLLFLLTGLVSLLRVAWQRASASAERLWLPVGWIVGILTLTATDPHFTPTHLIPLVTLGYVMAGVGWALLLGGSRRPIPGARGMLALAAVALLGFGLRTAQASLDVYQGLREGVSRTAVRSLLAKTFPGTGVTWAIGPTSIWPYVPQDGRPVLVDERDDPGIVKTALWKRVRVLILDSDFLDYGWGSVARKGVAAGWLKPIGQVGKPGDQYRLEAFRVEHRRVVGRFDIRDVPWDPAGLSLAHPALAQAGPLGTARRKR